MTTNHLTPGNLIVLLKESVTLPDSVTQYKRGIGWMSKAVCVLIALIMVAVVTCVALGVSGWCMKGGS